MFWGMSDERERGQNDDASWLAKNNKFLKKSNFGFSEWSKGGQGLAGGYSPQILSLGSFHSTGSHGWHIKEIY